MHVLDLRHDAQVIGRLPHMRRPETQIAWDTFLKATHGEPLSAAELEIFHACTGRQEPRAGGYGESVVITGRQSGKTNTAADEVIATAVLAPREGTAEGTYAVLVAQDMRGALRAAFRYICTAFEHVPMLAALVTGRTADSLTLENGVTIAVYPCRPAAVRGIRALIAVADELAFYRGSDGNPVDVETLRALRPALATTGGKLIVLSSPYGQAGALWDLHRRHFGREDSTTLLWVAAAPTMNPTLPADWLERMRTEDPEAYRSEVLGEFRSGLATLLDPEALDACVRHGVCNLLPATGTRYEAFVDPSGGVRDAFTAAVGHRDGERIVVDAVRAWKAPFSPPAVVAESATWLKGYGVRQVTGDRYAGEFSRELYRAQGIGYALSEHDRSQLYLTLLPQVQATAVEFPDDAALLRELRGLERKRGFAGRDRVDHRAGAHDDRANAVAGVVSMLARPVQPIGFLKCRV